MEERVKTSFIPKASLQVERKQAKPAGQMALANIIAGVILILAILGAAGVFLLQQFTVQQIASKQTSLEHSREAFEPATIKELSRLNARIEAAKVLLGGHVAVSKLFDELEKLTLSSVRFSDFSYDVSSGGKVMLTTHGEAASFNSVALQSGDFSKSNIITDPIFSGVNVGKDGAIDFDFSAVIDPSAIRYDGSAPAATPITPAPNASSTPQQ